MSKGIKCTIVREVVIYSLYIALIKYVQYAAMLVHHSGQKWLRHASSLLVPQDLIRKALPLPCERYKLWAQRIQMK